ncbi:hypothetical protein [Pseudomonas sp. Irchel 3E19]|nr:hypothetical protein [Pseudomonas sp. Irchel 3E19]
MIAAACVNPSKKIAAFGNSYTGSVHAAMSRLMIRAKAVESCDLLIVILS